MQATYIFLFGQTIKLSWVTFWNQMIPATFGNQMISVTFLIQISRITCTFKKQFVFVKVQKASLARYDGISPEGVLS